MNYDKLRFGNNKFYLNHLRSVFFLLMKTCCALPVTDSEHYEKISMRWSDNHNVYNRYIIHIIDITDVSKSLNKIVTMHVFIKCIY